jgi:hypothetical protein
MKRFTPLALVVLALAVVPQALADEQDWLDGKGGSPTDGESALDQAAQDLGRLSGSSG